MPTAYRYFLYFLFSCNAIAPSALAAGLWDDKLHFNGFYTLDASVTSSDLALLSNAGLGREFAKNEASLDNSLVGGQLEYLLSENFSAYLQGKLFLNADGDLDNKVDWAYLSADLGNDVSARIGQFLIPIMHGVEMRNVGYSRLWARPLVPLSGAGGYSDFQGFDIISRFQTNSGFWMFQVSGGQAEHDLPIIDNDGLALLALQYSHDEFWVRTAVLKTTYSISTPTGAVITDAGRAVMGSIEIEYTPGDFIINAGFSTADADITPNDNLYYLSLGVNIAETTPYILATHRNQHFDSFDPPRPQRPPPGQQPPPEQQPPQDRPGDSPGAVAPPPDGDIDIYELAVGIRWDLDEQYAIKFQVDYIDLTNDAGQAVLAEDSKSGFAATLIFEGVF